MHQATGQDADPQEIVICVRLMEGEKVGKQLTPVAQMER